MKRSALIFLILCCKIYTFSQTGPAGVGSSATNVFWIKGDKGTSTTIHNAPLNAWNDQSGNGINVTQTVAVQQPSFATGVLNGCPGIQFDNNNTGGQNDFLLAPDNSKLDNTPGYSFFTVSKMNNLTGDARCIVSKRTSVDIDEAFMLFYYTANNFYTDIDGISDRTSTSPAAYTTGTGYIMDVVYNGTLPAASRGKIYEGEILRKTFSEGSALVPDKISPLNVGCTHSADNRPFGGYISEVIIYTVTVNDAQRVILNNYLSAKYDIALTANNFYLGDNPSNGNYDREVSGIGKELSGSNPSFSASISGGITISNTSGLDNGDYIIAGHATSNNAQILYDVGGMTGTNNARWFRIWYIDITNTGTALTNDIEFDMSDGIVGTVALGTASDYVLLYRPGQTGSWTEMVTANSIVGDRVVFNGVTLSNDGYYTIGTLNYLASPLPIELLKFEAIKDDKKVSINWSTASEKQNSYFTIEKSKDAIEFETLAIVNAKGNSTSVTDYSDEDTAPYDGISYYRLKQTDVSGKFTYSAIVSVNYESKTNAFTVFPNPSSGKINVRISGMEGKAVTISITELSGKEIYHNENTLSANNQTVVIDLENKIAKGTYVIQLMANGKEHTQKIIIK